MFGTAVEPHWRYPNGKRTRENKENRKKIEAIKFGVKLQACLKSKYMAKLCQDNGSILLASEPFGDQKFSLYIGFLNSGSRSKEKELCFYRGTQDSLPSHVNEKNILTQSTNARTIASIIRGKFHLVKYEDIADKLISTVSPQDVVIDTNESLVGVLQ